MLNRGCPLLLSLYNRNISVSPAPTFGERRMIAQIQFEPGPFSLPTASKHNVAFSELLLRLKEAGPPGQASSSV